MLVSLQRRRESGWHKSVRRPPQTPEFRREWDGQWRNQGASTRSGARRMLKSRTSGRYRIRSGTIAADSVFRLGSMPLLRSDNKQEATMLKKPKSERIADRPTEDDIAQAEL